MDFFGFANTDMVSPVGMQIRAATDGLLLSPDWSKIIDICDLINNESIDTTHQAIRVLYRRFQESDPKIINLCLVLIESLMKNCESRIAPSIDKSFMDEIVNVAKGLRGKKNAEEAIRLIQEWGKDFEKRRHNLPIYFDTYVTLKSRGMAFPVDDPLQSSNTVIGGSVIIDNSDPLLAQFQPTNQSEFNRLDKDLDAVNEKVILCREMLQVSPGINNDEAFAEIIGFLEACRDRMNDLIEAGTHGLLGEELFAKCLKTNDSILKTLEAEKSGLKSVDDDIPVVVQKSQPIKVKGESESLLDFGIIYPDSEEAPVSTSKTPTLPPPPNKPSPVSKIQSSVQNIQLSANDDDEFESLALKKVNKLGGTTSVNTTKPVIKPLQPPKSAPTVVLPPPPEETITSNNHNNNSNTSGSLLDFEETITPFANLHNQTAAGKLNQPINVNNNNGNNNKTDLDEFLSSLDK
mmetsp:Transcript_17100/g.15441  ORF Transcript_17100/g.15441 Transcript_17100/m.15441 type:complete len:462 (+) Transcript_17100:93-1478(+)